MLKFTTKIISADKLEEFLNISYKEGKYLKHIVLCPGELTGYPEDTKFLVVQYYFNHDRE